jgi:hypothetical protein
VWPNLEQNSAPSLNIKFEDNELNQNLEQA